MTATTAAESTAVQATESNFIRVPERTLPDGRNVPSFLVAKYMASSDDAVHLVIDANLDPLTDINYFDAVAACEKAGLALVTESQYLSLALDIASVAVNWTGGAVGDGKLKQGYRNADWNDKAMPGSFVPADSDEDRWFTLSTGERICDAAGNLFTWTRNDINGDERGLMTGKFTAEHLALNATIAPSMQKGAGWQPTTDHGRSGYALIRGGFFYSEDNAGLFFLDYFWPDYAYGFVGVRCTKPE